jgi:hypothetical protein
VAGSASVVKEMLNRDGCISFAMLSKTVGKCLLFGRATGSLLCGHFLQCDVTAVGASVCRHYVIAHLLDITTGERYIYACIMLYILMASCTLRRKPWC